MFIFNLAYANFRITPAVVNILAEPMSAHEDKYIVTNVSDKHLTVEVTKEDWKNFSGNPRDISIDNWLVLEKSKFDIGPKESVEVPFKVVANKSMVGSVSGMLVFTVKGGMFNLSMKQPIYIIVKGTEKINFKIDSLKVGISKKDSTVYYDMFVKNTGNVHIRHSGVIEIYNKKTNELVQTVVIKQTFPVYTGTSRNFRGPILKGNDLKKGDYIALFKITALGKEVVKKIKFKV
jgi:hypothetical protein